MAWFPGIGYVPDSEGDYMADGSDQQGWDKDYAHCRSCDKIIDLDKDKWYTNDNDTYCEDCKDDCVQA